MKNWTGCVVIVALCALAHATTLERNLRGYGPSRAWQEGARVTIEAEDAQKALLWASRYDHAYRACRQGLGLYQLPSGGWSTVSCFSNRVEICYSPEKPLAPSHAFYPIHIPLFLNQYDDYAFRFYMHHGRYWNGGTSLMTKERWRAYDMQYTYDWALENGPVGLVFWLNPLMYESAKGLADARVFSFYKEFAEARHLPVFINTNVRGVPLWGQNDVADLLQCRAPGFLGSYCSVGRVGWGKSGFPSWAGKGSQAGIDAVMKAYRAINSEHVIGLLEPNGELRHTPSDYLTEFGPLVDQSFRQMLRARYGSVEAVRARWQDDSIRTWDDIHYPDRAAAFMGYNSEALDLEGDWTIQGKGKLHMPGHDLGLFLPIETNTVSRTFTWNKTGRTWLYVWDLSNRNGSKVKICLNDQSVAEDVVPHFTAHWTVCEVSDVLKQGNNLLELELPIGKICYKVYLTQEEPKFFPHLGEGLNAKWVDVQTWSEYAREQTVSSGMQTVRAVEPDKSVVMMAPDGVFESIRELAVKYGGHFHNTGHMAAYWNTYLPLLMRSKGLPFTLEPGGPPPTRERFKRMTNYYMSEGVNGIHYFIDIGNVMWNEEIAAEYKRRLPALKMLGRMRTPDTPLAMVLSSRNDLITGEPLLYKSADFYPSGYNYWRFPSGIGNLFEVSAITPRDLADGSAQKFTYLLDANNTVMNEHQAEDIARYVRAGGTYIAMFQTGRHSETKPDVGMLADLAGVKVNHFGAFSRESRLGDVSLYKGRKVQKVSDMSGHRKDFIAWGASLTPLDEQTQVLYRWADGTAAVTQRQVGAGRIIYFGLCPSNIYIGYEFRVLEDLLQELGAPLKLLDATCSRGFGRHFQTTDGLYDVFYADNASDQPCAYELRFRDGQKRTLINVLDGKELPLSGSLGPNEFVMGYAPREKDALSAWHWVNVQFDWWQGGGKVAPPPESKLNEKNPYPDVVDLSEALGGIQKSTNFVVKTSFTVPAAWTNGTIELWGVGRNWVTFTAGTLDVFCNGTRVLSQARNGIFQLPLPVRAGDRCVLEVRVRGDRNACYPHLEGYLYAFYRPSRPELVSLAGTWQAYAQVCDTNTTPVTLPGCVRKATVLKRTVVIPKATRVLIELNCAKGLLQGVICNGHFVKRTMMMHTELDVTSWVKFDQENELFLVLSGPMSDLEVREIRLVGDR